MNIQTNRSNLTFNGFSQAKKATFSPNSLSRIAGILRLSRNDVYTHTRQMNQRQYNFFEALTEKYNQMYHYSEKKENPQIIFKLAELIQSPETAHIKALDNISGSFENLAKIFRSITDKKDLEFARNFEKLVFNEKSHAENILPDILASENKEEYINHINRYRSYLKLNKDNENAVKDLDKMLSEGTYTRAKYDKQRDLEKFFEVFPNNHTLTAEQISDYYTPEGIEFIHEFSHNYHVPANFSDKAKEDLLQMYKTCRRENISMRKYILDKFQLVTYNAEDFNEEISAMRSIFEKIDNDKYVTKFLDKFLTNTNNIESLRALNEILDSVPADKAFVFHKNLSRLINITKPGKERVETLQKELTNPLYENEISKSKNRLKKLSVEYGYTEPDSKFDKISARIENIFNKIRYSFLHREEAAIKPETKIEEETKSVINNVKPETIETPIIKSEIAETVKPVEQQAEFIEIPKFEHELTKKTYEAPGIKLVNTVLSKAQKRKIEAQESIRKFINERLHPNIVNEQEKIYTNKATKMRIKMLPEILDSIKDTRAAQRAEGIKRPQISNYDAISLYTRIDGKNKKLINYMLKKHNSDGTRMFNINDILNEIGKVHKRVILEHLKPAQARELYEEAYQTKLNQYGKLKPVKNK